MMRSSTPASVAAGLGDMRGRCVMSFDPHARVACGRQLPGVVGDRVQAPAFVALQRAAHDELGDRGEIAQLEELTVDREVPVVLLDLALEGGDPGAGALEP